jgi:hypothetical protein
MKIKSNIKKKYFTCVNESMGVNINKDYVLRTKKNTDYTYTEHTLYVVIIILLVSAIFAMMRTSLSIFLSMVAIFCAFLYILAVIIITLMGYRARSKVNFKNEVEIDSEGISDTSYYGIKMTVDWDKVEAVVVRKNTIVILTSTPIYFYFDKNKKKDIITAIKKYKKDITIIE